MTELYTRHRCTVPTAGGELFAVLAEAIDGLSRRKARLAIMAGLVTVDGAVEREAKAPLPRAGAEVVCDLSQGLRDDQRAARSADAEVTVLYRDAQVLVVDKDVGILAAPDASEPGQDLPCLVRASFRRRHEDLPFLGIVHRIDRETSGCLVFALNHQALAMLSAQFAKHGAGRIYRCLVSGAPLQDEDVLRGRIGRGIDGRRALVAEDQPGKSAVTHFRVLERFVGATEVEVQLETGRTHQIRVQLAAIGCPILGDPVYGPRQGKGRRHKGPRLMLHARQVAFDHPITGARIEVDAPLPQTYVQYLTMLRHAARKARDVAG